MNCVSANFLVFDSGVDLPPNLLSTLQLALAQAQQTLKAGASKDDFLAQMAIAFGDAADLSTLQQDWRAGNFEVLSGIEVRSGEEMGGAWGAYGIDTDTIYLSQDFLAAPSTDVDLIVTVLLEEAGHRIDARVNGADSPGDEGAIFAALVQQGAIAPTALQVALADNDHATLTLDGRSVAVEQAAPGGVETNLQLWLRADSGVATTGNTLTAWSDLSGNGRNSVSVTGDPALVSNGFNFNPAIDFDGNDKVTIPFDVNPAQVNPQQYFVVFEQDPTPGAFGLLGNDNVGNDLYLTSSGVSANNQSFFFPEAGSNRPGLLRTQFNHGVLNGSEVFVDGQSQGIFTFDDANGGLTTLDIGSIGDFNPLDGRIAEVIVYGDGTLSAQQAQQVESYLALKYGIDLADGINYLDSQGNVIWNASVNGAYGNGVAGIGADLGSSLNQLQSRSSALGSLLTVGNGSDLNDGEFLIWGHDGATGEVTVDLPTLPALNQRLNRVWQVAETGDVGVVDLTFAIADFFAAPRTTLNDFALLIDNDAIFDNGVSQSIAATAFDETTVTFSGVDLSDGDYFTLGASVLDGYFVASTAQLINAIHETNLLAGEDTIVVTRDINIDAVLPSITDDLVIRSAEGEQHTLDMDVAARHFSIQGAGKNVTQVVLQDLRLVDGQAIGLDGNNGGGGGAGVGGAVFVDNASFVADNVLFENNQAIGGDANGTAGNGGVGGFERGLLGPAPDGQSGGTGSTGGGFQSPDGSIQSGGAGGFGG
ncbi:MAG: hypothetical protein HC812_16235, partial [Leptolyngbya sp. RL_3_1]|nr:hypothetical protein [Leptolyngbya sp. RL_3_1]